MALGFGSRGSQASDTAGVRSATLKSLVERTDALMKLKRWSDAALMLERSLQTEEAKTYFRVHHNLGFCYYNLQKYSEALAAFDASVRLNAKNRDGFIYAGLSAQHRSLFNEAVRYLETAQKLASDEQLMKLLDRSRRSARKAGV